MGRSLALSMGLGAFLILAAAQSALAAPKHRHKPLRWGEGLKARLAQAHPDFDVGVRLPPSGAPLMPACVPKYVTELTIPEPMPVDQECSKQGNGCYDFSYIKPAGCPKDDDHHGYGYASGSSSSTEPVDAASTSAVDAAEKQRGRHQHHHNDEDEDEGVHGTHRERHHREDDFHGKDDDDDEGVYLGPVYKQRHGDDDDHDDDTHDRHQHWSRDKTEEEEEHKQEHRHPSYEGASDSRAEEPEGCEPPTSFTDYYISAKRIEQEVLPVGQAPLSPPGTTCPASFKPTTVFAYGPVADESLFNWPSYTIESIQYQPNRIRWGNDLKDSDGNYHPHIFDYAVDQTLHWANPEGLGGSIDSGPCMMCSMTANCSNDEDCVKAATTKYTGPVPLVTHVHGMQDVRDYSDGYTEAWFMPDAKNIPAEISKVGTWYRQWELEYSEEACELYVPGTSTYIYANTQQPSTAWFHDHTLGLTRLNLYSGLTGFYFVRKFFPTYSPKDTGPELPGLPYPPPGGAVDPADIREIPLAIQDRAFQNDSSLWYPAADVPANLSYPQGVQPPVWVPELFFENTAHDPMMMTVNGKTWPKKALAPDTYRLRLLNGCNSRVLQLRFAQTSTSVTDLGNANNNTELYTLVPFYVVGNEAGFFPKLQGPFTSLIMGPAERFDVIIDLSGMTKHEFVYVINTGAESPYDGTNIGDTNEFTSQVMRFEFTRPSHKRPPTPLDGARIALLNRALLKQAPKQLAPSNRPVRQMALVEEPNPSDENSVRAVLLGTAADGLVREQYWSERVRTAILTNTVEEWDIINFTEDAHPIHLHESFFQIVERTYINITNAADPLRPEFVDTNVPATNPDLDPLMQVNCPKSLSMNGKCMVNRDTALVLPGTRTRYRLRTGPVPGLFVWHCHIVEHEDNEMMVPYCIGQPGYRDPKNPTREFCPTPK